MHHPDVRPTRDEDIFIVAMDMRRADRLELRAASGLCPIEGLRHAVEASKAPLTYAPNGKPAAIFGVVPAPGMPTIGAPWLLGTDEFPKQRRAIARYGPSFISHISEGFTRLINAVDARNTVHIAWLKRAGFEFTHRHERWGYEERLFLQFEKVINV